MIRLWYRLRLAHATMLLNERLASGTATQADFRRCYYATQDFIRIARRGR